MNTIISLIMSIIALFGLYPKTGYITEINDTEILIEDASGHLWAINQDPEDYTVGDGVSMIMSDNGTSEIYDDIIISVRYNGFVR